MPITWTEDVSLLDDTTIKDADNPRKEKNMATIFDSMTKEEAIEYCYKHREQFVSGLYAVGDDGTEQFDCLIAIIEGDTIKPSQLPEYGMDYEET